MSAAAVMAMAVGALGLASGCAGGRDDLPDGGAPDGGILATADGGAPDAGGADAGAADAGGEDAGEPDAGTDLDAGFAFDAGTPDGGALSDIDPACANHQGGEDCWHDWLKETGTPDFTAVAKGANGAGPWPTDALVVMNSSVGLDSGTIGVGTDTAGNIYAVSEGALYIRRAGAATFEKHARNTDGLRDYSLMSVAGGGPGVAYVGFHGVFGLDPETDPPEVRKSGDVQKIVLNPSGFTVSGWDTHNSNTPLTGKYDHSRSIFNIVVPRRGPAAGEVYLGTEHGVVRYQTDTLYADHRHIATIVDGSQRFGSTGALTVTDQGTMWYGNDFQFGGIAWSPRLYEWYFDNPWLAPGHGFGDATDRDYYEGIAVDSKGDVWAAAKGFGLAHLVGAADPKRAKMETVGVPDSGMHDLVIDADDTMWLAADGGVYRGTPDGKSWTKLSGVSGPVWDLFLDDTVTPRTIWMANKQGVVAYRGP